VDRGREFWFWVAPVLAARAIKVGLSATVLVILIVVGVNWHLTRKGTEADQYWNQFDATSMEKIDHSLWQLILDDYLVEDQSGINLFDYEGLAYDDNKSLVQYLEKMSQIDPRKFSLSEQMSYWINLYNGLTIQVIVENYPIDTINSLGGSIVNKGPWDDPVIQINGRELTLNDIEHRILRPIFGDYRIHFAVNCASIGCPNLASTAYSADNIDALLTRSAKEYLTHPRGLRFDGQTLHLSSLFEWYQDDFGNDFESMLKTLSQHTAKDISNRLQNHTGEPSYYYDWSLNQL
jgi:hypothetical protein